MRRAAKTDANATELDQALEALGWGILKLDRVGQGFPDRILVKHSRVVFAEYKDGRKSPSRRRLTEDEQSVHAWFKRYGVDVLVFESLADLAQLDRDARTQHEAGYVPGDYDAGRGRFLVDKSGGQA